MNHKDEIRMLQAKAKSYMFLAECLIVFLVSVLVGLFIF